MYLVWFLTVGAILSIVLGEFGQYPFGSTTLSISLTDLIVGIVMMLLLIWQVQTKTVPKSVPKFMWFFLVFWMICFISLAASLNFSGFAYLGRFLVYSSVVYLGYSLVQAKVSNILSIAKAIFVSGIILSLLGFIQLYFYPDLEPLYRYGYDPHKNRLFSTFLDPNLLGSYLNIALLMGLFLFWKMKSRIILFFLCLIGVAVVLTFSRSAYLMLGVELFTFFAFFSRKVLVGLLIAGVLTTIFVPKVQQRIFGAFIVDTSASERIVSWQNGFYLISQNPILGVGFNNIRESQIENQLLRASQKETVNSGSGLDSSLLFVGATTGIVGMISFISIYGYFLYSLLKNLKNEHKLLAVCLISACFGIVVNSQFVNSLFFTPIMLIWYVLVGSWFSEIRKK